MKLITYERNGTQAVGILRAGTIIATGTPEGVGMSFDPPRFLKKGDVVQCEMEGIGTLTNPIV